MNNKGQCGRDFTGASRDAAAAAVANQSTDDGNDGASDPEDVVGASGSAAAQALFSICPRDKHSWKHDLCMVCVLCGECTGYGPGCVSAGRPDRNPGTTCGCGSGDSGCSECGVCRACAGEEDGDDVVEVTLDMPPPPEGAGGAEGAAGGEAAFGAAVAAAAAGLSPGDLPLEAFAAAFGQGAQVASFFNKLI